jgi:molecular chaperone Hsp33
LQELPSQEGQPNDWDTIEILASTVTAKEMFELDCHELLYRLFNEEDIRLFEAEEVAFECSCSRERIEKTLRAMGEEELHAILNEQEIIAVTCEFCSETYRFYDADVEKLLNKE